MTEQQIIDLALENLQKNTKIEGRFEPFYQKRKDGEVVLNIDNHKIRYDVEIKDEWRSYHLQDLIIRNRNNDGLMVVATRLYPKIKEELRQNRIAYLEANGNIFLKNRETTIWIDVNKPIETERDITSRAFTKTGLKVVFQFLLDENWINKTYRQIAEQTGTGIGNITNIIRGLKQDGFLLPINKNDYRLNNKKELLNKWLGAYELKLKPTLKIGTFRFLKNEDFQNWRHLNLQNNKTWWGGEPAGDLLTNYIRPAELTLYTTEKKNDLIKHYRLIPDDKGNVIAYRKFWQFDAVNENIVPPLLIYVDLMNTNDRRCIETAQKIYDELLQNKF